jgi:hypothetical protein
VRQKTGPEWKIALRPFLLFGFVSKDFPTAGRDISNGRGMHILHNFSTFPFLSPLLEKKIFPLWTFHIPNQHPLRQHLMPNCGSQAVTANLSEFTQAILNALVKRLGSLFLQAPPLLLLKR